MNDLLKYVGYCKTCHLILTRRPDNEVIAKSDITLHMKGNGSPNCDVGICSEDTLRELISKHNLRLRPLGED